MSFKGLVFFFSSADHFVQWSDDFSNFGRGSPNKSFCEIILKSVHWARRCRLNFFIFSVLALAAILFSGAEQFSIFL